jgi:hypothetical protein
VLRPESARRCVLLFARSPRAEAAAKGIRGGEELFRLARERVVEAVAALPGVDLVPVPPAFQSGRSFGERLGRALEASVRSGYRQLVVVPGDVPELSEHDLGAAFDALASRDVVLGPARDGGVWLIGFHAGRISPRELLREVPWRTPGVFGALLGNAADPAVLGLRCDVNDRRGGARALAAARESRDAALVAVLAALLGSRIATCGVVAPRGAPALGPAPNSCRAPPFSSPAA